MIVFVPSLWGCIRPPEGRPPAEETVSTDAGGHTGQPGTDTPPAETGRSGCAAPLVIDEVQSANHGTIVDEDGDSSDWIEIYNPSEDVVPLEGWTLSDDDDPGTWSFPAISLPPRGFLLVYASGKDRRELVSSWDTRIDEGHAWRYHEALGSPDPDWAEPDYDDGDWPTGPSGFGRGNGDDATLVDAHTVYVRTEVDVTADELVDLTELALHVDYDDAFVAYLNGVEVARANLGAPGVAPAWDERADEEHEAGLYRGQRAETFDLDPAIPLLRPGSNTLALEVHDLSDTSSDLSLTPFLSLGFATDRGGHPSGELDLQPALLHTDFSLSADGEAVRLFDPSGCRADELDPGPTFEGYSFGRSPDGAGTVGYFAEPTPGAPNTTEARPGFAEIPTFDPPPGFWPDGVTVTVADPDAKAEVRVAWGGVEPTESDPVAAAPLPVTADGAEEAVVLRARAYRDGLWPSRIATSTWLLRDPGELPVVSLATDPPNLWDDETGIYTPGLDYDPEWPHDGANYYEDWEGSAHAELWEPDGTPGFAVDAGLQIHGGVTRAHDQRSFVLHARSIYGDPSIEHDVFPGLGITSFESLILRDGGNDWLGCFDLACSTGAYLRDAFVQALTHGDVDVQAYRPAETYLNGEFWGLYDLREDQDADYLRSHFGTSDVDLLELDASPVAGDASDYEDLLAFLRASDPTDPATWTEVQARIDTDELAAYLSYEIFFDNTDWPGNNIKFWRPRAPGGRWRWLLYDVDFAAGGGGGHPDSDTLALALDPSGPGWPNPPWSTELFRLLFAIPGFRDAFVDHYADELNTHLLPDATRAKLHAMADAIADEIPRQVDRWGSWTDGTTTHAMPPHAWDDEVARIDTWLGDRPAFARQHVVTDLSLGGTWPLELDADPPGSGTFQLTAVEVTPPFTGTYFVGVPVKVTAVPAPGRSFDGWSDPTLPATASVTLDPAGLSAPLVARFR